MQGTFPGAGRRNVRVGVTVTSAIALALGSAAVVAPTPVAHAQENLAYTGAVIDAEQQAKSEGLGDDACRVVLEKADDGKDVAGFRFDALNPGEHSESATEFGIQLHFNADKQRTFTDTGFSDSGPVPVEVGELGVVPAGEKLDGGNPFTVNNTAESAEITASRIQRNLNGAFPFTEQFQQQALSPEGLTFAWKGSYTKEDSDHRFFESQNFQADANANPWPSETDECVPLKLDWEHISKAVIKPGEKVKIASAGGMFTERDLDRLRIQVADGSGKVFEHVTITRDGSDFFLTWPKFADDAELDGLQGLTFTAVALPRSVEELEAIAQNHAYEDTRVGVTDSSIALPRYNTANELSSHAISVDDTLYHDPQFTRSEVNITSGISKDAIVFEELPDANGHTLADLKEKFDATITLDESLVYDGWTAKFADEEKGDYRVIMTAPEGVDKPTPGTFAQPVVHVRYSNGSKDAIPLLVVVEPNHTQQTNLEYPAEPVQGAQNTTLTAKASLTRVLGKGDVIKPKKFELIDAPSDKDGWNVTVDKEGTVTAKAKATVPNFTTIKPVVKATYPDGTTDEAPVSFQVFSDVKVPSYGSASGEVADRVTLTPTVPKVGLGGNAHDETPNRYTFPNGSQQYKVGDWNVTLDATTGELTVTIPDTALPGAYITVPVRTHYASGAVPQETTATINVIGDGTGTDVANYPQSFTKPGLPVSSMISTLLADPVKAKYSLPEQLPDGWTFDVSKEGVVTATPPKDARPGDQAIIDIHVRYPDGSEADVPAAFTVVGDDKGMNNPRYQTKSGKPGTTVTSKLDTGSVRDISEPKFALITDPEDKHYIAPPRNLRWEQVKIDPKTGTITAPVSERAVPGSSADIPVRVTYKDGTTAIIVATVVVLGEQRAVYEPRYEQQETKPGVDKRSEITEPTRIPARDLAEKTPFSVPASLDGWKLRVDGKGTVTATPPKDAESGDHLNVPVTVTYQDGSKDVVTAAFVVVREPAPDVSFDINTEYEVIVPFETQIVFDPTLDVGTQVVDAEHPGVLGTDKVTTTRTITNSEVVSTRIEQTRIADPQDRIVRVGTKETPGVTPEIHWSEETPYRVIIREDPTLEAGTHKVAQRGKVGRISYKIIDGIAQKPQVVDAEDQVILVGTKKESKQTELRETIHTPVPFETEIRQVDSLPAGVVKTIQEGSYGQTITEKTWQLVDGHVVGNPVEHTTTTKTPVKRIIEVGVGHIVPTYGKVVQEPGATDEVPLHEGSKVPSDATFEIDPEWKPTIPGWTATVDEHGRVYSTPPADAKPGDSILIPVQVTYTDGAILVVPAFAAIKETDESPHVSYASASVLPGETSTQPATNATDGNRYSVPDRVNGWKVSVDEHGTVTATAPKSATPGAWIRVPVTVTPAHGEAYTTQAVFTVANVPTGPVEPTSSATAAPEPSPTATPTAPSTAPTEAPAPSYPPAITAPGVPTSIKISGHTDGNTYKLGALPTGWRASVSATGDLLVTPPASAEVGEKVDIPVTVTTASGATYEVKTVVGVIAKGGTTTSPTTPAPSTPIPAPADSSADGFKRCMSNMFALNSPILWLLPIGLAAAVGIGVANAMQPQINAALGQFNDSLRHVGRGFEDQIAAVNRQFGIDARQLQPVAIALGAIAVGGLAISLIVQACQPEGFDHGMTVLGSSKDGEPVPKDASSKK